MYIFYYEKYLYMKKRAEIIISGRVQKAGFRNFIDELAFDMCLTGYVKNLNDGTVQIICEGEEELLREFAIKINIVQYPIRVEHVDVAYTEPIGEYKTFEIIKEKENFVAATYERMDAAVRYIRLMNLNLGNKIDGIGTKIDGIGTKIDGIGTKIDRLTDKVDGIGNKIDGLTDKVDGIGNKIDGLTDKVDGVGNKIDGVGEKIDQNTVEIREMNSNLSQKIDQNTVGIQEMNSNLSQKIDQNTVRIREMNSNLGEKIDQNRTEISSEIRITRDNFRSHLDERVSILERELSQIKAKFRP
jgi:acylphosphatase/uncharacterized coiled-coil DUF342 family protein